MAPSISFTIARILLLSFLLLFSSALVAQQASQAFDWVPTDDEIKKYRQSWNPLSEGPLLMQAVDIQPAGPLSIRPFLFSQISQRRYGNQLSFATESKDSSIDTYAVSPLVTVTYGLSNHFELGAATSLIAWWAKDTASGDWTTNTGMGDFSFVLKYRPIVQDPDSARPSITFYQQIVLPTSRWTGTERPPGGFAPPWPSPDD
jgi:hypothetical protein